MSCNTQQLNITCGTDVMLHDRLIFEGETFDPNLSVGIAANLVTSLGKRTELDVQVVDDELLISVPWVDGTLPGCYGLEVTGSCNSKRWSTYADSLIRYTKATVPGESEVTIESDTYDITQEVGYCYSNSPVTFAEVTVDNGYGTPSVDVTYEQRVLSMAFHNLKGNGITDIDVDEQVGDEAVNTVTIKTDADQEGTEFQVRNGSRGNGIASSSEQLSDQDGGTNTFTITDDDGTVHEFHSKNGTKGSQGDSAVYNPDDPDTPDFEMANTTGQSTTKAMTQKAITDEIVLLRGNYKLPASTPSQNLSTKYIRHSSGALTTASSNDYSVSFYEIPAGVDTADITIPKSGSAIMSTYAFATALDSTFAFLSQGVGNNKSKTFTDVPVKNGFKYLVVTYNSTSSSPTVAFHKEAIDFNNAVKDDDIARPFAHTYTDSACTIKGQYFRNTGVFETGHSNFATSDYISIDADTVTVSCSYSSSAACIVAFFDVNKSFIGGNTCKLANNQDGEIYDVPPHAAYMVISNKEHGDISIVVSKESSIEGLNETIDYLIEKTESIPAETTQEYNILHVGNSFTTATQYYLGSILANCGVNNVNMQSIETMGMGLDYYAGILDTDATVTVSTTYGKSIASSGTLDDVLSKKWDVIVFQQVSTSAGDYSTFTPHLDKLIEAARRLGENKNVKIGFMLSWHTNATSFANIVSAARQLIADYEGVYIIPVGTAVENARLTSMADGANEFYTGDGRHIANGVAKYVAGSAFFSSIIEPLVNKTVYSDTTFTATVSGEGAVSVTDANRVLCQKCAMYSSLYPFATLDVENL